MVFAIVKFIKTNDVAVVPVNWVNGNKCFWPPKNMKDKITPLIEKNVSASHAWEEWLVDTLGIFSIYLFVFIFHF